MVFANSSPVDCTRSDKTVLSSMTFIKRPDHENPTARHEEMANLIWITAAINPGIYSEKRLPARLQMTREIIQKEVPFVDTPDTTALPIGVEARGERGNQIESAPEIGQRLEGVNCTDFSFDVKKLD